MNPQRGGSELFLHRTEGQKMKNVETRAPQEAKKGLADGEDGGKRAADGQWRSQSDPD